MIDYIPIKGSTLARDPRGLGLVETDPKKIEEHKQKKLMGTTALEQAKIKEDINTLQKDVVAIKDSMDKVLSLLEKLA